MCPQDRVRRGALEPSFRKPGKGTDDHGFDPRLQGRMNHRCEEGAVIDLQIVDPACCLCLGVNLRISAADEPVNGRDVPCGTEATKVFAGRCRSCVAHAIGWEIAAQRFGDSIARSLVVDVEWLSVETRNLRWPRRARSCCFCVCDPLD